MRGYERRVGVNGKEQVGLLFVGQRGALLEGDEGVVAAGVDDLRAHAVLDEFSQAQGDIQDQLLFQQPLGSFRTLIVATVPGVDDDAPQLEPQRARQRILSRAGMLSGLGDLDRRNRRRRGRRGGRGRFHFWRGRRDHRRKRRRCFGRSRGARRRTSQLDDEPVGIGELRGGGFRISVQLEHHASDARHRLRGANALDQLVVEILGIETPRIHARVRVQDVEVDSLGIVQAVGAESEIAGNLDGHPRDAAEGPVANGRHRMQGAGRSDCATTREPKPPAPQSASYRGHWVET